MYTNNKKIERNAPNSACGQQQKSDGKDTHRIGTLLRVLIPALIISITLIACPDDPDTTAPTISGVSVGATTDTGATVTVSTNETGKLFWVAYADGATAPANAAALINVAGQAPSGMVIATSSNAGQTVSATGMQTVTITGLSSEISYDVYLVAQDAVGNTSSISTKIDILTKSLFFLHTNGVTVLCPNAIAGNTGTVNSVAYTKRIKGTITTVNAANTCTSGITDMSSLFDDEATFNQNIGSWDVSSVTNMNGMFARSPTFNQNVGNWNVGSVTNMSFVFQSASVFDGDIDNWDVSSVTNANGMFDSASDFNQNISGWNVSKVTNMGYMFFTASDFNQNISGWNVNKVTNMNYMFSKASDFNQNIGSWDVSKVTNMNNMLDSATNLNQNLSGWCVLQILSEPTRFSVDSPITTAHKPKWGMMVDSCPT